MLVLTCFFPAMCDALDQQRPKVTGLDPLEVCIYTLHDNDLSAGGANLFVCLFAMSQVGSHGGVNIYIRGFNLGTNGRYPSVTVWKNNTGGILFIGGCFVVA